MRLRVSILPSATAWSKSSRLMRLRRLARAALRSRLHAEAFRLRHQPIHFKVRELIEAGRIGEVRHVRNVMATYHPPEQRRPDLNWRFNKRAAA